MGLGYLALSAYRGTPLLQPADQDAGLVPAIVAQTLLGIQGAYLILVVVILAVVSTASSEVMAVTTIIVHDLYQVYYKVNVVCFSMFFTLYQNIFEHHKTPKLAIERSEVISCMLLCSKFCRLAVSSCHRSQLVFALWTGSRTYGQSY